LKKKLNETDDDVAKRDIHLKLDSLEQELDHE